MRYVILALAMLLCPAVSSQAQAQTQFSISIGDRGVSLGFAMSTYPTLVRIPGYPVYYDPRVDTNYFFYDGLYWVFEDDNWYSSTWYNGPWDLIPPAYVPLFILRIPVRYYRRPPVYFGGWRADAPPRWDEHWGRDWERQRSGWDHWNRRAVPRAAPLPSYQRNYSGSRYPRQLNQQRSIESRNYRYQSREAVSRQIRDQRRRDAESRDRRQQPQRTDRRQPQQQNVQQQQQRTVRQQQDVQQQQQRTVRQQQDVQQQQRRTVRQQQDVQQQQQRAVRQQQSVQQQQQRTVRQQQNVQQQQQRTVRQQQNVQRLQQRSQPAQKARGTDRKGGKGPPEKDKEQKDGNRDGGGPP